MASLFTAEDHNRSAKGIILDYCLMAVISTVPLTAFTGSPFPWMGWAIRTDNHEIRTMETTEAGMFVGTENPFTRPEVWLLPTGQ